MHAAALLPTYDGFADSVFYVGKAEFGSFIDLYSFLWGIFECGFSERQGGDVAEVAEFFLVAVQNQQSFIGKHPRFRLFRHDAVSNELPLQLRIRQIVQLLSKGPYSFGDGRMSKQGVVDFVGIEGSDICRVVVLGFGRGAALGTRGLPLGLLTRHLYNAPNEIIIDFIRGTPPSDRRLPLRAAC